MAFWRTLFKKPVPAGTVVAPSTPSTSAASPKPASAPPDPQQAHAYAATGRVLPIVKLLESGMSIDQRDEQGRTMLDVAIAAGQVKAARMLLFRGAALYDKANWQSERDRLREQMSASPLPHLVNQQLAALEQDQAIPVVDSFPQVLTLGMSNVCNARCVFCEYTDPPPGAAGFTSPEEVDRMGWLKHVTSMYFGGWAETLTNRRFPQILQATCMRYPHLQTHLCTNGIGLDEAVIDAMAGRLFHLNVSLNSPDREDWEALSRSHGFDRIVTMLKALRQLKQARGTPRPTVALSMVMHTRNHQRVGDFIRLAPEVGAQQVQLRDLIGGADAPATPDVQASRQTDLQALFNTPELRQAVMEEAQKQADALGLKLWRNESFQGKDSKMSRFRRGGDSRCSDPWVRCALTLSRLSFTHGRIGDVGMCCFGVPLGLPFHLDKLEQESFQRDVWNHPLFQFYRTTVNQRGANCVCDSCACVGQHGPRVVRQTLNALVSAAHLDRLGTLAEVESAFSRINAQFQATMREAEIDQASGQ
jgi:MoaA/NifB/PqqE/SkfB family radical SAM enzyme